ncbi:MAG: sulfate adenylyltransferase subunit CysN [Hyphomicrobiales bacterium]|nr:sulfate adenylyltransferase subunit CysN [Hyphomicrobiales bacterium]
MNAVPDNLPGRDVAGLLAEQETKSLLKFLTCGSVDDGKSTLIGRLLYDAKQVFDDQFAAVARDSRRFGTVGEEVDLALLLDGLEAEREQGITIDVAHRYFTTAKRKFIVADTPGHEQYTRNMATGASTSDLAVILVDARAGLVTQTRRHAYIVSTLGIRHVVLAVNKIDLVDFSGERFEEISTAFAAFTRDFGFSSVQAIPVSARYGDNVSARSARIDWYDGPTLIEHLESVDVRSSTAAKPFRMSVQWVNRPNLDFRGFSGTIASGRIRPGEPIVVAKSGKTAKVARIVTYDGDLEEAEAGEAVTLTLDEEIDISRGDLLADPKARPTVDDGFVAKLVWMAEEPLTGGRALLVKCGAKTVAATVAAVRHDIDVESLAERPSRQLALNAVARVELRLAEAIAFDPYDEDRETGAFVLIDRLTNATVAAGMIEAGLGRATNVHRQATKVTREVRASQKGQRPKVVWFTGLSGAGKSTIADLTEQKLVAAGRHTYLLDGDNLRHALNRDLGFSDRDRAENIRRVAEVAKLMADAGLIVLVSFISPFRAERAAARATIGEADFVEVFVDTPLEVCEARDAKGLYARARAGEIANFTGLTSPYEPPERPDLRIEGARVDAEAAAEAVVAAILGASEDWSI